MTKPISNLISASGWSKPRCKAGKLRPTLATFKWNSIHPIAAIKGSNETEVRTRTFPRGLSLLYIVSPVLSPWRQACLRYFKNISGQVVSYLTQMPFDPLQLDGYSLTLLKEPETSRKVAKSTK
jgi:hypothetical protein